MVAGSALTYNTDASALQMANEMFGSGVTVIGAPYSGSSYSSAIYFNGDSVSDFVTTGDTGVILSTGRASNFTGKSSQSNTTTNTGGANNNSDFNSIAGVSPYDASFMVVGFIPNNDTMTMQFVFSSEEYPEYTNSVYNDAIGVWMNGTYVPLSVASGGTTINSVNQPNNINLYNDHTSGTLQITPINGNAVTVGQTITLPTGQTVKPNPDGTCDITTDSDFETSSFTYQVESVVGSGNVRVTDVGFVTVETIPYFVAGTMIETANGPRAVETLLPDDLVMTRDDGPQSLRWIGRRTVPAVGKTAPIRIRKDALGEHGEIMVSPLHRVLVKDGLAELRFGEAEVLIAAKDLVNDQSIRAVQGGEVAYIHLLFDQHQVVYSEGFASESFLPGPQATKSFEAEVSEDICGIFPELDLTTGDGYGPAARPLLKSFEAETLRKRVA